MVVVLKKHNIAYFPVPKVANTSIRHGLRAVCDDPGDFMNTRNKRMSPRLHRLTEGCWRFAVVRDPLARMLSAYGNRVVDERDIGRSGLSKALLRLIGRSPAPDPEEFFLHLRAYMATNDRIRRHLMLQRRYLGDDLGFFDAIYPIEEIGRLAADLSERIGHEVTFGRHKISGHRVPPDALSPAARAALLDYLAPDYALLKDYYALPSR